ncbi:MAG TPA: glycosyltransferase family 39 protein [Patescibacteria group bacterium]|nr:glycosyltransferase family 39 protein [Patescibacteria group bacterium]
MLWLVLILVGFFLTRLYHLGLMPPFLDELIYVRWLNEIRLNGNWLIPLKEFGWEPLGIWSAALINRLIPDAVLSLRLSSVLISGLSLVLIYKLAGRAAALLYVLSPIILLHDRLGLRGDNLVVLAALMVFFGLKERLPIWIGLGAALGLFSKTTAAALPIVVVISYLIFRPKLKLLDFLAAFLAAAPIMFYWLSGTLGLVLGKQSTFVGEALVRNNLLQIGPWLYQYLTWPVGLLAVVGLAVAITNRLLLINWLVPFILLVIFAKILFPRYLLPVMPFLLIYAATGFNWLKQKLPRILRPLLIVFLLAPAWFSGQILKDLPSAPLPEIDKWQYVTGWPSGYGVKELVDYLRFNPPLILVVEDNDLIKTGINYYWPDNNLTVTQTATSGAYFVTNINHEGVAGELIKEFPRPENKSSLKLWRLN